MTQKPLAADLSKRIQELEEQVKTTKEHGSDHQRHLGETKPKAANGNNSTQLDGLGRQTRGLRCSAFLDGWSALDEDHYISATAPISCSSATGWPSAIIVFVKLMVIGAHQTRVEMELNRVECFRPATWRGKQ